MKSLKIFYYIIAVFLIIGCDSEDKEINSSGDVVADFSFTNDENLFVFTNLSKGATTYRWDFGDLSFYCDKENPTYRYTTVGGEVAVTLTAMDESGHEAYITKTIVAPEVKNIDIKIDGDFSDWEEVDYLLDQSASETGTMQKIKIWGVGNYINVYLEGNTSMKLELIDMFINADGNTDTGYLAWQWPEGSGAEYLFEGPPVDNSWATFYQHTGENGGWGWAALSGSMANFKSSGVKNIDANTNAIEFSIKKTQLGDLGSSIGIAIVELNAGWAELGIFPKSGGDNSFVIYVLPAESTGLCQ